jgi:hypothetical protein
MLNQICEYVIIYHCEEVTLNYTKFSQKKQIMLILFRHSGIQQNSICYLTTFAFRNGAPQKNYQSNFFLSFVTFSFFLCDLIKLYYINRKLNVWLRMQYLVLAPNLIMITFVTLKLRSQDQNSLPLKVHFINCISFLFY